MVNKQCFKCKFIKEVSEFDKASKNTSGFTSWCKLCKRENRLERLKVEGEIEKERNLANESYHRNKHTKKKTISWIMKDPQRYKNNNLKNRFGIDIDKYNKLLEAQDYKCKICGIHKDDEGKSLVVDHCHITGKIRGIICRKCNLGLGNFRDNLQFLENAKKYLVEDWANSILELYPFDNNEFTNFILYGGQTS